MNVAALLHDAPSDDHRTRNDVALHQHQPPLPQPTQQHDHRFPPPPYPHLPSPASIINLDDNRYDPRPPTRDRERDRGGERMLPLPHHGGHPHVPYQHQHPLHFPPHHQQHIIPPPPMLPPPPPHHSQLHHHVYDYPHDARVKYPLAAPPDRDRLDRGERDRLPGPPGYPVGGTSRTPPGYPPDQGRITPVTVISSRDRDPGHRREPHIAPEPVMGSLREREREQRERERDRDKDRDRDRDSPPPGHPFMPSHYAHHAPFSPNPHGPMTQPLPPPLALAPQHAQPKQRRRDNGTPVESPFMSDRERDRAADAREMERERQRDRQAREASLRESRDREAVGKAKRDRERDRERAHHAKHSSLEERQPASGSTLPLHPSHVQIVQRPPQSSQSQQQPQPHHPHHSKPSAFLMPNVPPQTQPQTLPLAPPHHTSSKKHQQPPPAPAHAQNPGGATAHQHTHHSHAPSPHQASFQPQPPPTPHSSQTQTQAPARVITHTQAAPPPPPPRSPTPPAPQPPLDLGTHVFPRTPFPYFFPPDRERDVTLKAKMQPREEKQESGAKEKLGLLNGKHDFLGRRRERERERDVEATILVPRAHLPLSIPDPLPIWGGGLGGVATRRVYTDDSPIVICALHAGFVTWSEVCAARDQRPGRDLKVRLRIRRQGAGERGEWSGGRSAAGEAVGVGRPSGKKKGKERERTDESVGLVSRAWLAPHDGSGVEILAVEWISPGTAHALHMPNRRARLAEYAERRQELMTLYEGAGADEIGRKRRRRLPNAVALDPIVEEPEEERLQARSLVWGRAGADLGFKFDPDVVCSLLFPDPDPETDLSDGERGHRPRKRRRTDADANPDSPSPRTDAPGTREMIMENDSDRYLISPCVAEGTNGMDVDSAGEGGRRYNIAIFPRGEESPTLAKRPEKEKRVLRDQVVNGLVNGASPKDRPVEPDDAVKEVIPPEQPPLDTVKDTPKQDAEPPSQPHDKDKDPELNSVSSAPVSTAATNGDEPTALASAFEPPASLTPTSEASSKPPLQDVATALEEGDVQFLPNGIRVAWRKVVGQPPGDVDEARSKLGWFVEVTRWRWREPPRNGA